MSTPTDAAERKAMPLATGVLDYFPDALLAVAECSRIGNEQHNPGEPLHWAKGKSTDEADALLRHLIDRGTIDTDGVRHSAKVAWRALALLQRELDGVAQDLATAPGTARGGPEATDVGIGATLPVQSEEERQAIMAENAVLNGLKVSYQGMDLSAGQDRTVLMASETWGEGDGDMFQLLGDRFAVAGMDYRGDWPPDTRVAGLLTCCGQSEHPITCPQFRA